MVEPGAVPRYCSRCGTALVAGSAFCSACGAPVEPLEGEVPVGAPGGLFGNAMSATRPALVYSGFWRRFWAMFIDGIVLNVAMFPITLFLARPVLPDFSSEDVSSDQLVQFFSAYLRFATLGVIASLLYFTTLESSKRQATLGKMILGIQVTDNQGRRISFGRAVGRQFGKFVSSFTLLIGYLIQLITARRQALHDLIAGTLVVRNPNP